MQFNSALFSGVLNPKGLEILLQFLKFSEKIIFIYKIFFKLLENDKDKKINHNDLHKHNKKYEIPNCIRTHLLSGIKHDYIPIFSCRTLKKKYKSAVEIFKIVFRANHISIFNRSE